MNLSAREVIEQRRINRYSGKVTPANEEYYQVWVELRFDGVNYHIDVSPEFDSQEKAKRYLENHKKDLHKSAHVRRCMRL